MTDRPLTARQLEILRLIQAGIAPKRIGSALHPPVSVNTVRHHIKAIAARLPGHASPLRKCMLTPTNFDSTAVSPEA
jgi:DNA-binding NarL/FixJ family response regulator